MRHLLDKFNIHLCLLFFFLINKICKITLREHIEPQNLEGSEHQTQKQETIYPYIEREKAQ